MLMEYRTFGFELRKLYRTIDTDKEVVGKIRALLDEVKKLDNAEIANRATCLGEGIELVRRDYIDIDSGHEAYMVEDYDYETIKKALGNFINFYYGGIEIIK